MSRKISSTILIAIAVITFFFYVNPAYENIKLLKAENNQFDEALDKARELQEVRDNLLSKYNTFSSQDIERLEKLLPDNVDNVRLILDLDGIASLHGLSLREVKIVTDITESGADDGVIGPGSNSLFNSIGLDFSVTATYEDFLLFLRDLEESLRLVDIKSLSFNAPAEDSIFSTYSVSLETYWLK